MKRSYMFIIAAGLMSLNLTQVSADVVGYVNLPLAVGDNLINNPLKNTSDLLSNLIPSAPDGTTVSLWNPGLGDYDAPSTFQSFSSSWTIDLTLPVGTGALLNTSTAFTNTWVGTALTGNGTNFVDNTELPPEFSGPDGTYLLGTITPISVTGEDVFLWTLGREPNVGEKVTTLDPTTQIYTTTAYLGSGTWDNGTPALNVAQSAFFVIPEPSSALLMGCMSGFGLFIRRRFMV